MCTELRIITPVLSLSYTPTFLTSFDVCSGIGMHRRSEPYCDAETNETGLKLLEFANINKLALTNNIGPHKPSWRWTWHSPDRKHHNQNDLILVRKQFQSGVNIRRTRSFPGAWLVGCFGFSCPWDSISVYIGLSPGEGERKQDSWEKNCPNKPHPHLLQAQLALVLPLIQIMTPRHWQYTSNFAPPDHPGADIRSDDDITSSSEEGHIANAAKSEVWPWPDVASTFQATTDEKFAPLIYLKDEDIGMDYYLQYSSDWHSQCDSWEVTSWEKALGH